jgi:hypothetical protein
MTEAQYGISVATRIAFLILGAILGILVLIKLGMLLFPERLTIEPIDWDEMKKPHCEIRQDQIRLSCNYNEAKNYEIDKESGCITKVECGD